MQWLTTTYMPRWHAHRGTPCTGPVYQGRFRSLPIEEDAYFLTVCRYIEPNAPRANLVEHDEDWAWCSLARWRREGAACVWLIGTDEWPVQPPRNCRAVVNPPDSAAELEGLRHSVHCGAPSWQKRTASGLKLSSPASADPGVPTKLAPARKSKPAPLLFEKK